MKKMIVRKLTALLMVLAVCMSFMPVVSLGVFADVVSPYVTSVSYTPAAVMQLRECRDGEWGDKYTYHPNTGTYTLDNYFWFKYDTPSRTIGDRYVLTFSDGHHEVYNYNGEEYYDANWKAGPWPKFRFTKEQSKTSNFKVGENAEMEISVEVGGVTVRQMVSVPIVKDPEGVILNGIVYRLNPNKRSVAAAYATRQFTGSLTLPDKVTLNNGTTYYVKSVWSDICYDHKYLTSVTLPNSIYNIGDFAFGYYWGRNAAGKWTEIPVPGFTVCASSGSTAASWAIDNAFTLRLTDLDRVRISKASKSGKKNAKVTFKINKTADGYEVQYEKSSTGEVAKSQVFKQTKKMAKKSTYTKTTKKLPKGTYIVRVRPYKAIEGIKCFGTWSTGKKVKI